MECKHVPVTLDNDCIHCAEWYGMLNRLPHLSSILEGSGWLSKSQMLLLANQEDTMNRGK